MRSIIERSNLFPSAPTKYRSTEAVKSPAAIPIAKNGTSGRVSRFQSSWDRFHHSTTRIPAGRTQITLFDSSPSKNSPSAIKYVDKFLVRSNLKYNNAE